MQVNDMIGAAELQAFKTVGALHLRGVISPEWLAQLKVGFDEIKADAEDMSAYDSNNAGKGQTLVRQQASVTNQLLRQFLFESPLARMAANVLGSESVCLYEDLMIYKSAGAEQPTPWHQDEPQWPLQGLQMCSAWFCLDPVTAATGSLRFKPGSHNGPLYRPYAPAHRTADLDADDHLFEGALPDVNHDMAHIPDVCFDTEPGDIVLFHPRSLHAAFGSAPNYARRTFSIRFIGDDVRWQPKKSVFYEWLGQVKLNAGDRIVDEHFPVLYSASGVPA